MLIQSEWLDNVEADERRPPLHCAATACGTDVQTGFFFFVAGETNVSCVLPAGIQRWTNVEAAAAAD